MYTLYIYIYIYSNTYLRRSALSVCPRGDTWGTPIRSETSYSWPPAKPARGQTPRSPRPKVTSVLTQQFHNVAKCDKM